MEQTATARSNSPHPNPSPYHSYLIRERGKYTMLSRLSLVPGSKPRSDWQMYDPGLKPRSVWQRQHIRLRFECALILISPSVLRTQCQSPELCPVRSQPPLQCDLVNGIWRASHLQTGFQPRVETRVVPASSILSPSSRRRGLGVVRLREARRRYWRMRAETKSLPSREQAMRRCRHKSRPAV